MDQNLTDNNPDAIPTQEGKRFLIKKRDMKVTLRPCREHDFQLDKTETTEYWQGYQCTKCGIGKLRAK